MSEPSDSEMRVDTLFFDVGGVLLTNGWDRYSRRKAAETFGFDASDYDARHDEASEDFETGRLSRDQYLDRTVFHEPRDFTRRDFVAFMEARSEPYPETLAWARSLAADGRYRMATLNDESEELNRYRIDTFGLAEIFGLFFSSCYLGLKKPDPRIFRAALGVVGREPKRCLFLDDRPHNVEAAREAGLYAVEYRGDEGTEGLARLRRRLTEFGIEDGDYIDETGNTHERQETEA